MSLFGQRAIGIACREPEKTGIVFKRDDPPDGNRNYINDGIRIKKQPLFYMYIIRFNSRTHGKLQ